MYWNESTVWQNNFKTMQQDESPAAPILRVSQIPVLTSTAVTALHTPRQPTGRGRRLGFSLGKWRKSISVLQGWYTATEGHLNTISSLRPLELERRFSKSITSPILTLCLKAYTVFYISAHLSRYQVGVWRRGRYKYELSEHSAYTSLVKTISFL